MRLCIKQWFPNFNQLEGLGKCRLQGPIPQSVCFNSFGQALRICILNKLLGDAAANPGPTLWEPRFKAFQLFLRLIHGFNGLPSSCSCNRWVSLTQGSAFQMAFFAKILLVIVLYLRYQSGLQTSHNVYHSLCLERWQ